MVTCVQVEYETKWEELFKNVKGKINGIPLHEDCWTEKHLCSSCRNCLISWVDDLRDIPTIPKLRKALEHPVFLKQHHKQSHERCRYCKFDECKHRKALVTFCHDLVKAMPDFTEDWLANYTTKDVDTHLDMLYLLTTYCDTARCVATACQDFDVVETDIDGWIFAQNSFARKEVNFANSDITIESSDNVRFLLHRKNLETHTEAFPGSDFESDKTNGEVVKLTEAAEILEVLFQFVYLRNQPVLSALGVETLLVLAEAVQKYQVFSAKIGCEVQLRKYVESHSISILVHALKHYGNYETVDLVNTCASLLVRKGQTVTID
ncbi:hypothetical protein D9619_006253 [Psilocybe cf. subviscida]|uniref:BTB domain-containing protein n=1 Tax=Psilocybe cf. subviscida TaxID=2480587 RepID=A0A8H5B3V2_9AGAR|nr:hypothetical protein D9619_006253 [Psilocybe cf. subviscida]